MFNNLSRVVLGLSLILIVVLIISANNFYEPANKVYKPENEEDNSKAQNNENELNDNLEEKDKSDTEEITKPQEKKPEIEYALYDGIIENIFFHPLIAYTDKAFDDDNRKNHMDTWFITVDEFEKILHSLYENDYILINMDKAYKIKEENGKKIFESRPFELPKGKKPLVISIDDLNYYDYMKKNGTIHKLILDENNNIAEFTQFEGQEPTISYNKSIINILESFIETHEDFSFKGARGIIALTGYNGIFGYDTSKQSSPTYKEDLEKATKIAERLKNMGWLFASHGYSHLDAREASYDSLAWDCHRWDTHVRQLTGPTNIYVYPFGASLRSSDPKYGVLIDYGFDVFMGVGRQTPIYFRSNSIYTNRLPIDGHCLKGTYGDVSRFFNIEEIIDNSRPNSN